MELIEELKDSIKIYESRSKNKCKCKGIVLQISGCCCGYKTLLSQSRRDLLEIMLRILGNEI